MTTIQESRQVGGAPSGLDQGPVLLHYALAVACTAGVLAIRLGLDVFDLADHAPFLLFAIPIVVGAWAGGFGPGLTATALSALAVEVFWLDATSRPGISNPENAIILALFVVQGVLISWLGHSRFRALHALRQANEDLERRVRERTAKLEISNRELQDFASVASHDLQEPLRKIQAFGGRLSAKCGASLSDEGHDYLRRMQNAANRMQTLINDLLSFSRVTTKAQPFVRVDLTQVAHEVVSDLEASIENASGTVLVEELPEIDADPMQIRQLFQNMIGNALKFTRPQTPAVVRISGRVHAAHGPDAVETCEIQVADNGIGFEEKYLDRIFNVFQRLHGRGVYEGTGIGLAVCRKIVERHGGTITAQSQPGEGTTFIVTLPTRQPLPEVSDGL